MKQFLIEFTHDSSHLGFGGFGLLLVMATTFEEACLKVSAFSTPMTNEATGYKWNETFKNARNFINLTV